MFRRVRAEGVVGLIFPFSSSISSGASIRHMPTGSFVRRTGPMRVRTSFSTS
jgi:hypothetical protein